MFLDYYLRIKIKRSHMDILEITQKQDPLYPTFEQIYTASFPLFEQRTEERMAIPEGYVEFRKATGRFRGSETFEQSFMVA